MDVSEESLRQRYSEMETEELVELYKSSDLTDLASSVIEQIISERGVSIDPINRAGEEVVNEGDNFRSRYKKATQEEEERKQRERDGEFGEARTEYRQTIDATPLVTKIASFGIWAIILYGLYWLLFT